MATRNYSNTGSDAQVAVLVGSADSTAALANYSGFPSPPYIAALDPDTSDEEIVLVTAAVGSTVTITRAYDGTTAKTHSAGAVFRHVASAKDFQEANAHINATTGVHGTTGAVVGTNDTQTLSNKTLVTPTISSPTVTGTLTGASAAFSGTLTVPTLSVTNLNVTDLGVADDLTVLGDTSLAGATLSGALSGTTAAFSGLVTAGTTPTAAGHLVPKSYADALGTAAATASTIMRRDGSGNTAVNKLTVATTSAASDAARKDFVETTVDALKAAFAMGASIFSTPKVPNGTALTGTVTVSAASVPTRITFWCEGRSGFAAVEEEIAWEFDTTPAGATNVVEDYDGTKVTAGVADWATVVTSISFDMPAGQAATARPILRSTGDVYNRGVVRYIRIPI